MSYKIAIPTHRRFELFQNNILSYLDKCGVARDRLYLIMSDKEDADKYKAIDGVNVIFEKPLKDLKEKHNFIVDYFNHGEEIVCMEDDVECLTKLSKTKRADPFYKFDDMCKIGFKECRKHRTKLWGISPTCNDFYMSNRVGACFKFIASYCFGMINDRNTKATISHKHDYERTILNFIKFGSVIRLDMIGQKSHSFKNKGGLQCKSKDERAVAEVEANNYLINRYKGYVKKKSRFNKELGAETEVRLVSSLYKG
jgi:hypothetical protein